MENLNASDRLRFIVDFMLNFPTREQLVVFLSHNVCPKGELSGVCTAALDTNGEIHFEYFYGFNQSHKDMFSVKIMDDDPASEAMRTMKTSIINLHEVYREFSDAKKLPGITDYGTAILLPTTSRRIYIFVFAEENSEFTSFHEYFACIRSILTFWEVFTESSRIKSIPKPDLVGRDLTARQKHIFELITEGKTNAAIALILGYSESLIRQETIIIYRKLQVDGRRELRRAMVS